MPEIKLQHIVSVSTEDKNYPAENLLKNDSFKKWKCVAGEKQAVVVFQFEKASAITQIDIGNESSAFIEVLVGKSSSKEDEYQVILVASSFMNPTESRASQNPNRVRIFGSDQLSKAIAGQKWDRAKVVCTQQFNKSLQYGLSFIKFHSSSDGDNASTAKPDTESKPAALGAFKLKSDTDTGLIRSGSLFERNKSKAESSPSSSNVSTGAAAIRAASKAAEQSLSTTAAEVASSSIRPSSSFAPAAVGKASTVTSSSSSDSGSKSKMMAAASAAADTSKRMTVSPPPSKKPKVDVTKSQTASKKSSKPFERLMSKVVFVLSGFQNPERSDLRDAAMEMGATYKPDWEKGCTHLVCAFENTPKYVQVSGQGRIVKNSWITDCHKQKALLPWRKYRLGRAPSPKGSKSGSDDDDDNDDEEWDPTSKSLANKAKKLAASAAASASGKEQPARSMPSEASNKESKTSDKKSSEPTAAASGKPVTEEKGHSTGTMPAGVIEIPAVGGESSKHSGGGDKKDDGDSAATLPVDQKQLSDDEWDPFADDLGIESDCDTEEEIRRFEELQAQKAATPQKGTQPASTIGGPLPASVASSSSATTAAISSSSSKTSSIPPLSASTQNKPVAPAMASSATSSTNRKPADTYDLSTDDEDANKSGHDSDGLPVLPDFFAGKTFMLHGKFFDRRTLIRYIVAYNGRLADYMGDAVKYVITDDKWDDTFDQALSENSELVFVRPAWILACHSSQRCLPHQKYAVVAP